MPAKKPEFFSSILMGMALAGSLKIQADALGTVLNTLRTMVIAMGDGSTVMGIHMAANSAEMEDEAESAT